MLSSRSIVQCLQPTVPGCNAQRPQLTAQKKATVYYKALPACLFSGWFLHP